MEVISRGPATPEDAFLSIFVEALAVKLWAEIAPMDVAFAAALFSNGSNAGIVLKVGCGLEAFPL